MKQRTECIIRDNKSGFRFFSIDFFHRKLIDFNIFRYYNGVMTNKISCETIVYGRI